MGVQKNMSGVLKLAAAKGDNKKVRKLLDGGADVNARTRDSWTPLQWAMAKGHTEMVALLEERGGER